MLKRDTNLLIKLVLVIILVCILAIVLLLAESDIALPQETQKATRTTFTTSVQKELNNTPILFSELEYVIYYEPWQTEELLVKLRNSISTLEKVDADCYTKRAARAMSKELIRLQKIEAKVASDLEHYLTWENEYYYATKVWEYFRQRGFSNEVTCAIIGNMMIETSGGSLALNPTIYSPSGNYYGLCQWSTKYHPGAKDLPFEQQLDYLLESMPWEFNTFGNKYKSGFKYEDFLVMTDVEEAALAFTKSYERCSSVSYKMRQEAAEKAYEYFNLD